MKNPYIECPVFRTKNFELRLVTEYDAEDLLKCYCDTKAQRFFNSDNCTSNFCFDSVEEMRACIQLWIDSYIRQNFIRFAIIYDKNAIGTIEMYGRDFGGVLRIDLCSDFENESYLSELFQMSNENFYGLFGVDNIITKIIPEASERVIAAQKCGFSEFFPQSDRFNENYYIRAL